MEEVNANEKFKRRGNSSYDDATLDQLAKRFANKAKKYRVKSRVWSWVFLAYALSIIIVVAICAYSLFQSGLNPLFNKTPSISVISNLNITIPIGDLNNASLTYNAPQILIHNITANSNNSPDIYVTLQVLPSNSTAPSTESLFSLNYWHILLSIVLILGLVVWLGAFLANKGAEERKIEEIYEHKEMMVRSLIAYREQAEYLGEEGKGLSRKYMNNLLAVITKDPSDFLPPHKDESSTNEKDKSSNKEVK